MPLLSEGDSIIGLLPPEFPSDLEKSDTRCAVCPISPSPDGYPNAAVIRGTVSRIPYFALVFRSYSLLPPEKKPWYMEKTYSYLAESMDKLMSRSHKLPRNIPRYEAQLNRMCTYVSSLFTSAPADTNISEIVSGIVNTCAPMLSTMGVCADIEYDDALYTVLDCPTVPAGDLIAASIFLLIIFSNDGRLKINRAPVEGTRLIEYTVSTHTSKKHLDSIHSFSDIISYPSPVCLDLAAMKDCADAFDIVFDIRRSDDELVFYLRSKGRMSDSIEMRSPELMEHIYRHFTSLCTALYDLVKLSVYDKDC